MSTKTKRKTTISGFLNLMAVTTSFIGVVVLSFGCFLAYLAYSTSSWPSIKATVIESRVARVETTVGYRYRPVVKYRFSLGEHEFVGQAIKFIDFSYKRQQGASEALFEFPLGREVDCRFNPNNPNMTVLQPGVHLSDMLLPTVGAALISAGLFFRSVRRRYFLPSSI